MFKLNKIKAAKVPVIPKIHHEPNLLGLSLNGSDPLLWHYYADLYIYLWKITWKTLMGQIDDHIYGPASRTPT